MTLSGAASTHFSKEEIADALHALPEAGWIRLRKIASAVARLYRLEWEELLQEAYVRALDGSRNCPRDVDIFKFFGDAMRSIASDTVKAARRHPLIRLVAVSGDEGGVIDLADDFQTPSSRSQALKSGICSKRASCIFSIKTQSRKSSWRESWKEWTEKNFAH